MAVTVESCISINIGNLQGTIRRIILHEHPKVTKDEFNILTIRELEKFEINGQRFKYTSIPNKLGGHRWFFLCPQCEKKCTKLFLPPIHARNRESLYKCKVCHRLKNQSAIMGQNILYRKVTKPLKTLKIIEERIQRGYLKKEKIQELLNQYEAIEKQLQEEPEYRLYIFKKKHGMI